MEPCLVAVLCCAWSVWIMAAIAVVWPLLAQRQNSFLFVLEWQRLVPSEGGNLGISPLFISSYPISPLSVHLKAKWCRYLFSLMQAIWPRAPSCIFSQPMAWWHFNGVSCQPTYCGTLEHHPLVSVCSHRGLCFVLHSFTVVFRLVTLCKCKFCCVIMSLIRPQVSEYFKSLGYKNVHHFY